MRFGLVGLGNRNVGIFLGGGGKGCALSCIRVVGFEWCLKVCVSGRAILTSTRTRKWSNRCILERMKDETVKEKK